MLTFIGCGNVHRSDDGVGVAVVQRLRVELGHEAPAWVRIVEAGTSGVEAMLEARGSRSLVVVDACRGGGEPGTIVRLAADQLAEARRPTFSMHDFRWPQALALGRRLLGQAFPAHVEVWLVEAERLDIGGELSSEVAKAVAQLCRRAHSLIAESAADAG